MSAPPVNPVVAFAPGRVNIIGEHTDYSGGFVLPMAIPQRTTVTMKRRSDDLVEATTTNIGPRETATFGLGEETKPSSWIDYVQGTTMALRTAGHRISGFDLGLTSTVPIGSGLSSSAALEVALLRGLRQLFRLDIDDLEIAVIARAAETDFVGTPIGIMDQMASSLADPGLETALFIDTRSLAWEKIPIPASLEIVVVDSGLTHDHVTSGYRERRMECERAAATLGVAELRDVTDLTQLRMLPEILARRARHVVTENARVLEAVASMRDGNVERLGALLDESHASLRDDFEVSVAGVDDLVARAQAEKSVYGARMTGGGFGGAIVALVVRGEGRDVGRRIAASRGRDGSLRARVLVPEDES